MNWCVLHLKPRTEKRVATVCARHGIRYDLPMRVEIKIYQRRKIRVEKPLFPGYVFACLDEETRIQVKRTNHIVKVLRPADEQQLEHELAQIRQALTVDPGLRAVSGVHPGQRVRIKGGVFLGVEGVVVEIRGKEQVRLQIDMIGQAVPLHVEQAYVERLPAD